MQASDAVERWEVRPCKDRAGNYDICLPVEPGATGVVVIASVYAGKEVADEIVWQHNASPLKSIAVMMSEFVDNWPEPKRVETALKLIAKTMRHAVARAKELEAAGQDFTEAAQRQGPTNPAYWVSYERLAALTAPAQAKGEG